MNYAALAQKHDPFEGLSDEEAQRLVVYLHILAPNRMNDGEIFRKYGYVLPLDKRPTGTEELRMAAKLLQELN